jgi:hypothetical protein
MLRWMLARKWKDARAAYAQNHAESNAARERAAELEVAAKSVESTREEGKARRDEETARLARAHDALAAGEVALSEECAVSAAEAAVETLVRDRNKHAGERKEEFFADLAAFDTTARGDDIDAIDVELPENATTPMPRGIVLVFAADIAKNADAYVLACDPVKRKTAENASLARLPCALTLVVRDALRSELPTAYARVAERKRVVVAAKFALAMRACIADVQQARAVAEAEHQRRLGALESQRIPHPAEFRARQIARSEPAIEKGADDVLASALVKTHDELAALRKAWIDRITNAPKKRQLDEAIDEVNQRGKLRVLELLEATSEHVAREMQSVGETLERWALDEIQTSYRVQKRVRAESLAPVASEVTGEDLATVVPKTAPVAFAREAFQRARFRISTGVAVAAAVAGGALGMLAPAAHHAPRVALFAIAFAVLGSFAGLFKSITTLRADALSSAASYADTIDTAIASLLRTKRDEIARGIRTALDDALGETLERLNDAITRLMTIEKNAIEAERARLANLDATRGTLEEHDARLAENLAAFQRLTDN